jgi:hypothetical protein
MFWFKFQAFTSWIQFKACCIWYLVYGLSVSLVKQHLSSRPISWSNTYFLSSRYGYGYNIILLTFCTSILSSRLDVAYTKRPNAHILLLVKHITYWALGLLLFLLVINDLWWWWVYNMLMIEYLLRAHVFYHCFGILHLRSITLSHVLHIYLMLMVLYHTC